MCLANIMKKKRHRILGKPTEIQLAFTEEDSFQNLKQLKSRKIIFKNIRKNTEKELLEDYFKTFGTIIDFRILYKGNSKKKTFGFVTFQDKSSVENVMNAGTHQYIENLDVNVK